MTNKQKLIPELHEWQKINGQELDIEDWITIAGNINLAIGYSFIFWPHFIEHDNCVFLKSHFSLDIYNEWKTVDYVDSFSQIEYVINHIHILDLFAHEIQAQKQPEIEKDQVIYLGNVLREIYETKLRTEFKERKFIVTFNGQEEFDDLIDYELSFYQKNNVLRKTKGDI